MPRLFFAAAFLAAFAAPVFAQPPTPADDPAAALPLPLPGPEQIEDMAPALDRMADALLHTDVGPILDAADPLARDPDHGVPGRTVGRVAGRDDPYFEQRVHASIYRGADKLARASAAVAAAAPALARSMHELRHSLREAARAWREAYENGADGTVPGEGIPTGD
jgi:hypothetical protein